MEFDDYKFDDYKPEKMPDDQAALKISEARLLMQKCLEAAQEACHKECSNMDRESREKLVSEFSQKLFSYYLAMGVVLKEIDYSAKPE